MTLFYYAICLMLLLALMAGLWCVFFRRDPVSSLLAVQLMSTTCVALLLLLATVQSVFAAVDIALVFALLAAVTLVAFVRNVWQMTEPGDAVAKNVLSNHAQSNHLQREG